jgi:hypothetical protein
LLLLAKFFLTIVRVVLIIFHHSWYTRRNLSSAQWNWWVLRKVLRHNHVVFVVSWHFGSLTSSLSIRCLSTWRHYIIVDKFINIDLAHDWSIRGLHLIDSGVSSKIMWNNKLSINFNSFIFVFNHHSILFTSLWSNSIVTYILWLKQWILCS